MNAPSGGGWQIESSERSNQEPRLVSRNRIQKKTNAGMTELNAPSGGRGIARSARSIKILWLPKINKKQEKTDAGRAKLNAPSGGEIERSKR